MSHPLRPIFKAPLLHGRKNCVAENVGVGTVALSTFRNVVVWLMYVSISACDILRHLRYARIHAVLRLKYVLWPMSDIPLSIPANAHTQRRCLKTLSVPVPMPAVGFATYLCSVLVGEAVQRQGVVRWGTLVYRETGLRQRLQEVRDSVASPSFCQATSYPTRL